MNIQAEPKQNKTRYPVRQAKRFGGLVFTRIYYGPQDPHHVDSMFAKLVHDARAVRQRYDGQRPLKAALYWTEGSYEFRLHHAYRYGAHAQVKLGTICGGCGAERGVWVSVYEPTLPRVCRTCYETREVDGKQLCTHCNEWKEANAEQFRPVKNTSNKLDSWCRACRNAHRRARRRGEPCTCDGQKYLSLMLCSSRAEGLLESSTQEPYVLLTTPAQGAEPSPPPAHLGNDDEPYPIADHPWVDAAPLTVALLERLGRHHGKRAERLRLEAAKRELAGLAKASQGDVEKQMQQRWRANELRNLLRRHGALESVPMPDEAEAGAYAEAIERITRSSEGARSG